jgi:hypothetical protein
MAASGDISGLIVLPNVHHDHDKQVIVLFCLWAAGVVWPE